MFGGTGNDTLSGWGGDDSLSGGDGNDTIYGGTEVDSIDGGAGDDLIYAGAGDDQIASAEDNDTVFGEAGNDTILGGFGVDDSSTFYGGDGDDRFVTYGANDEAYGDAGNDVFVGDSGSETFFGGTGNDEIYGGVGNDTLDGGAGNDTIDGGGGNDTIFGGAGDDTITTGAGNDTFVQDRFGGGDTVTDFDVGDADSDGFYNDQLDVSALRTLGGDPVRVGDVVVDDDGSGNARLTFPEGETIILQGITPAQMDTNSELYSAGIPCFTTGTMIQTPRGEVPIETLRPGDLVNTRDNGPQPLVWSAMRRLNAHDLARAPHLRPVVFAPGAFGQEKRLLVSPQHGMLLSAKGDHENLVRAIHLARKPGGKIRVAKGIKRVTYVHLMFESHQIITANGLPSESFYPGPWGLQALDSGALKEMMQLFPNIADFGASTGYGETARKVLAFRQISDQWRAQNNNLVHS